MPVHGKFDVNKNEITFIGQSTKNNEGEEVGSVGTIFCSTNFSGGKISADIEFEKSESGSTVCEFILNRDIGSGDLVNAGIGGSGFLSSVRTFTSDSKLSKDSKSWTPYGSSGFDDNIKAKKKYHLEVEVKGNTVNLSIDNVLLASTVVPNLLSVGQPGILFISKGKVTVTNFTIVKQMQKAFVVMEYSSPYNELYNKVIKPAALEFDIEAFRADDTYGPGIIISDIIREINESAIIIAEITPTNPNVYYELGYAHALKKPTILIAKNKTDLPFDVSPFRTLFYTDTIEGREKIENGLKKHLEAILNT